MAKEYYVELGGKKRLLRYTRQERVEIESRFDCDIKDFVYAKAFPLVDGKPTLGGRIECQEALIFYGLRHSGPKVTEDQVSKWLQEKIEAGGSIYEPLSHAIIGLLASGVMGWNPPLAEAEEEADEGKEKAGDEKVPRVVEPIKRTG
jgi:hypothetical protein